MHTPTIALITGGYSSEAVISYKSAVTIEKHIDPSKYKLYKIDITPNKWFYKEASGAEVLVNKDDFSLTIHGEKVYFDAVFIGIHGTPGEDGKLQGYFDLLNIPYTSCNVTSSAITFNKRYTVAIAGAAGYPVAKSIHLFRENYEEKIEKLLELHYPVFVKPNNGGSSIGMSKISSAKDLQNALQKAFKEDDQVLVEEYIAGREFTIGVFKSNGKIITLPFTEIITQNDFFDFEAKYQGKSTEITPAVCNNEIAQKIRNNAAGIYAIFNCRGIVRMDFIFNEKDQEPYLLEINTVPGQSDASIVPQQVAAMGMKLQDFYSLLIEDALQQKK